MLMYLVVFWLFADSERTGSSDFWKGEKKYIAYNKYRKTKTLGTLGNPKLVSLFLGGSSGPVVLAEQCRVCLYALCKFVLHGQCFPGYLEEDAASGCLLLSSHMCNILLCFVSFSNGFQKGKQEQWWGVPLSHG